ncbi:tetratricopeptide repeat protein [Paenibacillus chitinolyticus]|uniref:tetratricopeptide repeat protein n=1 Tax=Paenibacillus chitinolyticus TaxID=79263 RepID=UPI00362ABD3F
MLGGSITPPAVTLYKKALDDDPANSELLFYYGWLLEAKGRILLQKAANYFTKGIENHPGPNSAIEHKLNYQLIQVRAQLFQNNQSVEFYKQRLSERPDDPQVYCYLIQCYSLADQIQEMKKVLEGYEGMPLIAFSQKENLIELHSWSEKKNSLKIYQCPFYATLT